MNEWLLLIGASLVGSIFSLVGGVLLLAKRISTKHVQRIAVPFAAGAGIPGVIAEALMQDAERRTNAVVPNYLAPVGLPRSAIAIPVLLVVGTWLSVAPPPPLLQEAIEAFRPVPVAVGMTPEERDARSEEHTSELQSH